MNPRFNWQIGVGLGFKTAGAAPASAVFGGPGFDLAGYAYARPLLQDWGLAGKLQAGLQIVVGGTIIRIDSAAALDSMQHAADIVRPFSTAWGAADGPWRMDGGLSWRIPFGFDPTPVGQFSIEYSGLLLGVSSGLAFGANGALGWDGYLVTRIEYYAWPLFHTSAVPIVAGIAWRLDPTAISVAGNLLLYFGIYGQSVSTGSPAITPRP